MYIGWIRLQSSPQAHAGIDGAVKTLSRDPSHAIVSQIIIFIIDVPFCKNYTLSNIIFIINNILTNMLALFKNKAVFVIIVFGSRPKVVRAPSWMFTVAGQQRRTSDLIFRFSFLSFHHNFNLYR